METEYDSFADYYDFMADVFKADIPLYISLVNEIPRRALVVELFCGTGRVAIPLLKARQDIKVFGIDISQKMLNKLFKKLSIDQKKRLKAVKCDALQLADVRQNLGSSFGRADLCILAFSDIQYIKKEERDFLYKVTYHLLKPGGRFVFDDSSRNYQQLIKDSGKVRVWKGPEVHKGRLTIALYVDYYDRKKGCQSRHFWIFTWPSKGSDILAVPPLRFNFYPVHPLKTYRHLKKTGFKNIHAWSDFKRKKEIDKYDKNVGGAIFEAEKPLD